LGEIRRAAAWVWETAGRSWVERLYRRRDLSPHYHYCISQPPTGALSFPFNMVRATCRRCLGSASPPLPWRAPGPPSGIPMTRGGPPCLQLEAGQVGPAGLLAAPCAGAEGGGSALPCRPRAKGNDARARGLAKAGGGVAGARTARFGLGRAPRARKGRPARGFTGHHSVTGTLCATGYVIEPERGGWAPNSPPCQKGRRSIVLSRRPFAWGWLSNAERSLQSSHDQGHRTTVACR